MCYACSMRYHANASCISHNLMHTEEGDDAPSARGAPKVREASPCVCVDVPTLLCAGSHHLVGLGRRDLDY